MKTLAILGLAAILTPTAFAASAQSPVAQPTQAGNHSTNTVVLDRVIAVVNGEVLLQSDVDQEQRLSVLSPLAIPHSQDTDAAAARRLIRRTLVLEQMKQQDQPTSVSTATAENGLHDLRATLHGCAPHSCATPQGWSSFLNQHHITRQEAIERWSQRMAIENFINLRFRAGIHITSAEISTYYQDTLVPTLKANQVPVPPLQQIAPRIEQLLLEQHVNTMISQWLQSLRAEGSVQILVPAYGKSSNPAVDSDE